MESADLNEMQPRADEGEVNETEEPSTVDMLRKILSMVSGLTDRITHLEDEIAVLKAGKKDSTESQEHMKEKTLVVEEVDQNENATRSSSIKKKKQNKNNYYAVLSEGGEKDSSDSRSMASEESSSSSGIDDTDNGTVTGYDPISMEKITVRKRQNENQEGRKPRKSVVALGSKKVEIEALDQGATLVNVNASNLKHPKIPTLRTLDHKGYLALKHDYGEYTRLCKAQGVPPSEIVHCLTYDQTQSLAWGHPGAKKIEVSSHIIWQKIKRAQKDYPKYKDGLILKNLPKALEGKYDTELDNVRDRAESLYGALKRYLEDHQALDYYKASNSNETDGDESGASQTEPKDQLKLKRREVVKCIVAALKPKALMEQIDEKTARTPRYMYHPDRVFRLIIKYGDRFEYTYQRTRKAAGAQEDNTKTRGRFKSRDRKNRERSKTPDAQARSSIITDNGAKCECCGEAGHFFLAYDKEARDYVKNCPKTCDISKYESLRKSIIKTIKEKRQRYRANSKKPMPRSRNVPSANAAATNQAANGSSNIVQNQGLIHAIEAALAAYAAKNEVGTNMGASRSDTLDNLA